MEELCIELKFKVEDFREIYYRNGMGNIFTNKPFRNAIILPFLWIGITIIIYFLSFKFPAISWLMMLCALAVLGSTVFAIICFLKFSKWKTTLEKYFKSLSAYNSYKLLASENSIEVSFDSETTIERWDQITSARIEDSYVALLKQKEFTFIFPAKSMEQNEYDLLKQFVRKKLK